MFKIREISIGILIIALIDISSAIPQRGRFRSTTAKTPSDSSISTTESVSIPSTIPSRTAADKPLKRLRRPNVRRSTTPIPASEDPNPNKNQNSQESPQRNGLIEKLCNRKAQHATTSTSTPSIIRSATGVSSTTALGSESTTAFTSQRIIGRKSRLRNARSVTCTDFDNLSLEELIKRVKSGRSTRRRNREKIE